jgi:hypothetical protein
MTKVNLQPSDRDIGLTNKRGLIGKADPKDTKRTRTESDDEEAVDYGSVEGDVNELPAPLGVGAVPNDPQPDTIIEEDGERVRIHNSLESWCRSNVTVDEGDVEGDDRVAALAEVGMLLVFDQEKYPDATSMRAELEDIGSIIGGDQVVKKYINFLLSLQNQLKKYRIMAVRDKQHQQFVHNLQMQQQHQQQQHHAHFPMMMPHPPPMYHGPFGMMMQPPPPGPRGNMTLNATGEMSVVQKQKEKERKRKEILNECTGHLKALLERVSKTTTPEEKAKIFELIDKVKKRIDSLRDTPPPNPSVPAKPIQTVPKAGIRGFFGNQYVNPNLVEKSNDTTEQ